jgi:hypothetical protein
MKAPNSSILFIGIGGVVIVLVLFMTYFGWRRFYDPQGEETSNCQKINLASQYSPNGKFVASGHTTICDGFGGNSAVYVYIHSPNVNEGASNLVFRYFEHGGEEPPTMRWATNDQIEIAVHRVSQITKALSASDDVKISYRVGLEDHPRSD